MLLLVLWYSSLRGVVPRHRPGIAMGGADAIAMGSGHVEIFCHSRWKQNNAACGVD